MEGDYRLTPEQEELRTRGLRILARIIVNRYLNDRVFAAEVDARSGAGDEAVRDGADRAAVPNEDNDEAG